MSLTYNGGDDSHICPKCDHRVFDGHRCAMRFAFADPPYIGQARKHYAKEAAAAGRVASEVNHWELIETLKRDYDAWALSLSTPSLEEILHICRKVVGPNVVRPCSWVKPFASFKPQVRHALPDSRRNKGSSRNHRTLVIPKGEYKSGDRSQQRVSSGDERRRRRRGVLVVGRFAPHSDLLRNDTLENQKESDEDSIVSRNDKRCTRYETRGWRMGADDTVRHRKTGGECWLQQEHHEEPPFRQ